VWAQQYRDCFPRGEPEPDPNEHLRDERVQVGHYYVSRRSLESREWTLPEGCACALCAAEYRKAAHGIHLSGDEERG
jgi:hypothetical protein